jgi:hypothetical protein
MGDVEVAPKSFLLLAADKTREVLVSNRAAHWHGWLRFDRLGLLSAEESVQSAADRNDQIAQIGHGDGVPGDVGDDDLGCELGDRPRLLRFLFFGMLRHGPPPPDRLCAG